MPTTRFAACILAAVLLVSFHSTVSASACACCAAPGEYSISTGRPSAYQLSLLEEIAFAQKGYLFLTEADFDAIKGLDDIKKESAKNEFIQSRGVFDLVSTFARKTWKFNMLSKSGKSGILTLPLPSQMLMFKVDTHDDEESPGGPMLYKEWRFKGTVYNGSGIFKAGIVRPTTYFLVFQGRGNGCDNSEDFTHWRLEINGSKARYAFYGKLGTDDGSEMDASQTMARAMTQNLTLPQ